MKISILIDNTDSWFNEYFNKLSYVVRKYDSNFSFVKKAKNLTRGDILFIISCNKILSRKQLSLNKHNIVIHESDLPKGRGWSPLTWQIERGKKKIPITLFEAVEGCDRGCFYIKSYIQFKGTELIENLRHKQAMKTIEMIGEYLSKYPMRGEPQKGNATYYRRREPKDNQLNIDKSIKRQFNKLRVADNE